MSTEENKIIKIPEHLEMSFGHREFMRDPELDLNWTVMSINGVEIERKFDTMSILIKADYRLAAMATYIFRKFYGLLEPLPEGCGENYKPMQEYLNEERNININKSYIMRMP